MGSRIDDLRRFGMDGSPTQFVTKSFSGPHPRSETRPRKLDNVWSGGVKVNGPIERRRPESNLQTRKSFEKN